MATPPVSNAFRVVGVAASVGGVEALTGLVAGLPSTFPAPLLVVLHMPSDSHSRLAEILERAGPLPAAPAQDGAAPRPGMIHVAQPDRHLVVSDDRMWLVDGPRENSVRPAADPLFRSLARVYRARAVGVVLSGTLDDGTNGLSAIAAAGGTTMVQDPGDALARGMPSAALQRVRVDHVAPVATMGALLAQLVGEPVAGGAAADPILLEEHDEGHSEYPCPECLGMPRNDQAAGQAFHRCHAGHGDRPEAQGAAHGVRPDAALWTALRVLEQQASHAAQLADELRAKGYERAADRSRRSQEEASARVGTVRVSLLDRRKGETDAEATVPTERLDQAGG